MTILELFKKVDPSVLAAKMIFKHLQDIYPVLKISDIADTSSGGTPSRGMIEYYNGDIPWVKSGELKDGLITNCNEYITESGLKNSSAKLFPKGTLLVAMYGANIGKTGVLDFNATTNQAVCAIFPKVEISKDFLFWYFKQQRIDFIAIGKGGAQPNISQTVINNASIVVPDVKIQKLIVDFLERIERGNGIDEKFFIPEVLKDVEQIYKYKNSYVDLTDSFENQLIQLENLKQAILQEAVQGKLVKQNPKDEPASELLKRIKAEKSKSGKKEKPLPPIKPEEIPFEISESWVWCRLGEISKNVEYGTSQKAEMTSEHIPVLRMNNIQSGKIDYTNLKYVSESIDDLPKLFLVDGDMLFNRTNSYELVGKTATYRGSNNSMTFASYLIRVQYDINVISEFISNYINSPICRETQLEPEIIQQNGQANFNGTKLQNILIPLPPLSEQTRIVAEIEKQLAKTKRLKEHIIANQHATEQLLKALLHGAFEMEEREEVHN